MPNYLTIAQLLFLLFFLSCAGPKSIDYQELLTTSQTSLKRGLYTEALEGFNTLKETPQYYNEGLKGVIAVYQDQGKIDQLLPILAQESEHRSNTFLLSALGGLYRDQGSLKESLQYYEQYLAALPDGSKNVSRVNKVITELELAIELIDNPHDVTVRKLDKPVNSSFSEYAPSLTLDEERLIFTRELRGQEDLYEAVLVDSKYVVNPIEAVNTRKYNEGAQSISGNGRKLVFTHCNEDFGYGGCDLYESTKINGQWSKPKNMGKVINGKYWESQPALNADGTELYFASNRPSGMGGSDIWKSTANAGGVWSQPINLGDAINTPMKEQSPFIHPDGQTIYFSSDGHLGIGGFDLFLSRKSEQGWSTPQNIGAPINTVYDDHNLIVSTDGLRAYYSRQDSASTDRNIYEVTLPEGVKPMPTTYLKLSVLDKSNGQPLMAAVDFDDIDTGEGVKTLMTDPSGRLLTTLPIGRNLAIHVDLEGYLFHSENIYYPELRHGHDPYIDTIYLQQIIEEPIAVEEAPSIILNNIFFDSGSADLKPESEQEISYIYTLLNSDPTIYATIIGHTDNVGSESDNQILSERRAKAIKAALVKKSITDQRITTLGKGESEPIDDNTTEEGRKRNRRTELKINRS
jgi:outer membrane protein OmpA-like peptidoglycan-associated protein/Tol biopolymer transport system component